MRKINSDIDTILRQSVAWQAICAVSEVNKPFNKIGVLFMLLCCACNRTDKHLQPLTPYEVEHITSIQTGKTTPFTLVNFACSLAGIPYHYGSVDPKQGFDCSGFVTYVFNHFGIRVPRTSVDFTPVRRAIALKDAKLGDLILFTGTDSGVRVVGHMGIVSSMPGEPLRFMHATSGKGYGVVETDFHSSYYEGRYLKTIRVFVQNDH